MRQAARELRELVDSMPPGATRNQALADLECLRTRLAALPGRVAEQAEMKSAEEVRVILDREIRHAFAPVMQWIQ